MLWDCEAGSPNTDAEPHSVLYEQQEALLAHSPSRLSASHDSCWGHGVCNPCGPGFCTIGTKFSQSVSGAIQGKLQHGSKLVESRKAGGRSSWVPAVMSFEWRLLNLGFLTPVRFLSSSLPFTCYGNTCLSWPSSGAVHGTGVWVLGLKAICPFLVDEFWGGVLALCKHQFSSSIQW